MFYFYKILLKLVLSQNNYGTSIFNMVTADEISFLWIQILHNKFSMDTIMLHNIQDYDHNIFRSDFAFVIIVWSAVMRNLRSFKNKVPTLLLATHPVSYHTLKFLPLQTRYRLTLTINSSSYCQPLPNDSYHSHEPRANC